MSSQEDREHRSLIEDVGSTRPAAPSVSALRAAEEIRNEWITQPRVDISMIARTIDRAMNQQEGGSTRGALRAADAILEDWPIIDTGDVWTVPPSEEELASLIERETGLRQLIEMSRKAIGALAVLTDSDLNAVKNKEIQERAMDVTIALTALIVEIEGEEESDADSE